MVSTLPSAGGASQEVCRQAHDQWLDYAKKAGIDLTLFDPRATLEVRIAWALGQGLDIAAILSRFSSKLQRSTLAQVMDNIVFAAQHGMYVPPELICVDEGVSGRKSVRDGLTRMKLILASKLAKVLLVFKVSRLFRIAYLGFQFFQEEVVENDLRAISISQGIDTADQKQWKMLAYMYGIMDEVLLTQIADHVRSGLKDLFRQGYVTGALGVGFRRVVIEGGLPTNRGFARTMPEVDIEVAKMIVRSLERIDEGMPISRAHRLWVAEGGPCDPRSKLGYMSYAAFRRLISNPRLTGLWAFGKLRNLWSSKRDYNRQVSQPELDVLLLRSEELRIVEDALFLRVQAKLQQHKGSPRGPKKGKPPVLWDLLTDCFQCEACTTSNESQQPVRFYVAGAHGKGMRCKRGHLCPCGVILNRREAVLAIVAQLQDLLLKDEALLQQIDVEAVEFNERDDGDIEKQIAELEQQVRTLDRKIKIFREVAGQGHESDDEQLTTDFKAAQSHRAGLQTDLRRLRKDAESGSLVVTPAMVRDCLNTFPQLLSDATAGVLGEDLSFKAAHIIRELIGGRVTVRVISRPGRSGANVQGVFAPRLLHAVRAELGLPQVSIESNAEVSVWLRKPPRCDLLAERVHEMIDVQGLSYRDAAKVLQEEGWKINCANTWQIYRRYYEMIGMPLPDRPYNNGRPRRTRV